jgi:hypothetical protein
MEQSAPAPSPGGTAGDRPGAAARRRWRLLAVELIPIALLAAAIAGGLWGFSYDDAFITYRYAENWAAGRGLVFNPGEAVLGTTAPGWALLLGALARASAALGIEGLGVPEWGTLLTVAALWWLTAALPALWLPAASPLRPALPLLLGTLALTCRWNLELLGAEAFPAAALAATSVWLALGREGEHVGPRAASGADAATAAGEASAIAHRREIAGEGEPALARRTAERREIAAGLAVAAAMLCRLDAALAAVAIGIALRLRRRRAPWRFAIVGLAPVAPYLAWLEARFGTVVPNTLAGKRGEVALAPLGYDATSWAWLDRAFGGLGRAALVVLAAAGAAWLLWRALAAWRRGSPPEAGGASSASRGDRTEWRQRLPGPVAVLAAWLLLHEAFYRAAGVPFAPWYHVAMLNALLALAAVAVVALLPAVARVVEARLPWELYPAIIAMLAALAVVLLPGITFLAGTWGEPPDVRTRLYAAVGRHLREHSLPGTRVAAMEIGALACTADRPVLDLIGLVSPEVLRARAAGRLPQHVAEAAPEYILVPPPFLGRELGDVMRHPEIRARYRPAARFFDPAYEHDPVTLYRRRGGPATTSGFAPE